MLGQVAGDRQNRFYPKAQNRILHKVAARWEAWQKYGEIAIDFPGVKFDQKDKKKQIIIEINDFGPPQGPKPSIILGNPTTDFVPRSYCRPDLECPWTR
jgi:hypothetical protein